MWLIKIFIWIAKLFLKLLLIPVLLVLEVLSIFSKVILNIGSAAAGLILTLLFAFIILEVIFQYWVGAGVFFACAVVVVAIIFGAGLVDAMLEGLTSALMEVMVW